MTRPEFEKYTRLSERFLDGRIGADAFCRRYMRLFKAEDRPMADETFASLNRIFTACDCYDPYATPDEVTNLRLDEATLRAEVAASLRRRVPA
jgi:hypothetical protein